MTKMWMVRAGRDSVYAEDFLQEGIISIGWTELEPVETSISKDDVSSKGCSQPYGTHNRTKGKGKTGL